MQKQVMLSAVPSLAAVAAMADESRPPLVAIATRGVTRRRRDRDVQKLRARSM